MTVTAPPRPPRPSDPVDREELEALVEALIEEARQRARRRRRTYAASAALVALVVVAVSTVVDRTTQPDTASPALAARSSGLAAAATQRIAFTSTLGGPGPRSGGLFVVNADGSGLRKLTPIAWAMPSWSSDGRVLAFVGFVGGRSSVSVMSVDGSAPRLLARDAVAPAWSPDGRRIAFMRFSPAGRNWGGQNWDVYVMNTDGSGQRRLARNAWLAAPAWSPDGRKIAFERPRRDRNAEGDIIRSEIFVVNADGSGERRLTRNTVRDSNPVWSPDGRRIAFESNWQLNVMNADGSGQRRLTRNGGRNFAPAWSPDGQQIVFERRLGRKKYGPCSGCGKASTFEIHVMNADGTGPQRLTTKGAQPGWSPDGQKIAFMSERDGNPEIYTMNADGSQQRNLTRTPGWHESWPVWSPVQKP